MYDKNKTIEILSIINVFENENKEFIDRYISLSNLDTKNKDIVIKNYNTLREEFNIKDIESVDLILSLIDSTAYTPEKKSHSKARFNISKSCTPKNEMGISLNKSSLYLIQNSVASSSPAITASISV